ISELRASAETQVFYEAPHRLLETLGDIVQILGARRGVVVARELTKIYEEFVRGPAARVLSEFQQRGVVRGEITLLIAKAEGSQGTSLEPDIRRRIDNIQAEQEIDEKAALKVLAKELGVSKSEAYRRLQRAPKSR